MASQLEQRAAERLMEDERLRADLTDDQAKTLLNWGLAQLSAQVARLDAQAAEAQAAVDGVTQRIRAAMREINDLVPERGALTPDELAARLRALAGPAHPPEQVQRLASAKDALSDDEFVVQLTGLVSLAWDAPPAPSGAPLANATPPAAPPAPAGEASPERPPTQSLIGRLTSLFRRMHGPGGPPLGFATGAHRRRSRAKSKQFSLLGFVALILVAIVYYFTNPSEPPAPLPTPSPVADATTRQPGALTPAGTSVVGSWYQVYFTTPKFPDNKADHRGGLDEKLTAFISTAQKSVDMAIYQLDLPNVTQAVLDAKKRGCAVRVVTDVDILDDAKEYPSFKQFQAAKITVVGGNANAIMHDKFVVVDKAAVWSGSWNFTENDTYRYNNNGILMRSPELAQNYTVVFEKMWRDKLFGPQRKPGGTTPVLSIGGTRVENYFAPEDDVTSRLIPRLQKAQKSIHFMAFSFTDDTIGQVVRDRAKAGVKVRGVFENTGSETEYSEYGKMKAQKLDVLQDSNPYLMHHKVFVVDEATVILGSFNFSQNAETENDENLLIIDDAALAKAFVEEFGRVYATAQNPPKK